MSRNAQGYANGLEPEQQPRLPPTFALGSEALDTRSNKPSLQRRVQNALRWKSWGGEQSSPAFNNSRKGSAGGMADWASPSDEPNQQRHRVGHSVGSDVELSSFANGATSNIAVSSAASDSLPSSPAGPASRAADGTAVSRKSSTSSYAGPSIDNNSSTSGAAASTLLQSPGHNSAAAADDLCSVATQAGSRTHSFTSLYSMMTDQGDQGSDAGLGGQGLGTLVSGSAARERDTFSGPSTSAAGTSAPQGPAASYRGSDTGADEKASVSTLPLISETAYDEEQLLDDEQHIAAEQGAHVQGFTEDHDEYNPLQSIVGRPRVSSSHGSITSSASDMSAATGAAGSAFLRIPSPGHAAYGRSHHGSQRSSGRSAHGHQQQQQLQQQQDDGLPLPFSTRKRPENDETCSYATQAGSVHSVSSIMSSAFVDSSTPQRSHSHSASGEHTPVTGRFSGPGQQQQQYPIHPLSEPDELEYYEGVSSEADVDVGEFGVASSGLGSTGEGDSTMRPSPVEAGHGTAERAGSIEGQLGRDGRASHKRKGHEKEKHHPGHTHQHPERAGSLKGAFKSVVAWGSGLGQRLQRVSSSVLQTQQPQQQSGRQEHAGQGAGAGSSRVHKGPASSQEMANL